MQQHPHATLLLLVAFYRIRVYRSARSDVFKDSRGTFDFPEDAVRIYFDKKHKSESIILSRQFPRRKIVISAETEI